jgi:hypothetical protein
VHIALRNISMYERIKTHTSMKAKFNILAIAAIACTLFFGTGCKSPSEKVDDAEKDVAAAKEKLEEARQDSIKAAEEWRIFKVETQEKIAANNIRIAELRTVKRVTDKPSDAKYAEKVAELEERNRNLQQRIDDYEKYHSDWETFKREFNHDMDELGKALKDVTVDNEK